VLGEGAWKSAELHYVKKLMVYMSVRSSDLRGDIAQKPSSSPGTDSVGSDVAV